VLVLVGWGFGGLKSCLSTWKPFGLGESAGLLCAEQGLSERLMRGFAVFDQVTVGGAEACPDGSTRSAAHRVEGKVFMV